MTTQKRTRRPKGSGGEWRDEKGVWHIRIDATPDPRTGNRRRITATGPTRTAARQKLRAKLDAMERSGTLPLTDIPTLDVWIDRWLKTITPNVKPRTLETYTSDCNTIRSRIGGMKLDKITAATIEHMCADLAKTHSSKTVHNHYIRLKQILQAAVREKLIPSNPALAAIPPRYTSQATAILKAGQPAKMAEAARKPAKRKHDHLADTDDDREMWSLMWNLAFETGMRQAERFAILPEELATIDGVHGIQIMWELQRFKSDAEVPNWLRARHYEGGFWLVEPKSKQGNRFVPVSNQTWLSLWALVGRRQCQPGQLIFTREGHPLTNTVERRRWKRALEDAGLPYVTIRSARHFFSTNLAEAGAPEDARKAMMGHAKITTTAGYTHWSAESLAALADKAREAVGGPA